jgi:hypothetical protein
MPLCLSSQRYVLPVVIDPLTMLLCFSSSHASRKGRAASSYRILWYSHYPKLVSARIHCIAIASYKSQAFSPIHPTQLGSTKTADNEQTALGEGTLVEFEEKSRTHIGKILQIERKSNGSVRYDVEEYPSKKHYSIADKEVTYSIPAPPTPKKAEKLLEELQKAQAVTEMELRNEIGISPELLEMAWEEVAADEETGTMMTSTSLIELVHSHSATPIENYMAWRLLKAEVGHVFFKELKENGRVMSFKPKNAKSVMAAKANFCAEHQEERDFCFAPEETDISQLKP